MSASFEDSSTYIMEENLPVHLSGVDLSRYRSRELSGPEMVRLFDHIAGCEDCRERVATLEERQASARAFVAAVAERVPPSKHLTYRQKAGLVDQTLARNESDAVTNHIRYCTDCAVEVRNLEHLKAELGFAVGKTAIRQPFRESWRAAFDWRMALAAAGAVAAAIVLIYGVPKRGEVAQQPSGPADHHRATGAGGSNATAGGGGAGSRWQKILCPSC